MAPCTLSGGGSKYVTSLSRKWLKLMRVQEHGGYTSKDWERSTHILLDFDRKLPPNHIIALSSSLQAEDLRLDFDPRRARITEREFLAFHCAQFEGSLPSHLPRPPPRSPIVLSARWVEACLARGMLYGSRADRYGGHEIR